MKKDSGNVNVYETRWLLRTGLVVAIASLLACFVPLILFLLGISRIWMPNLITLDAFRPYLLTAAIIFVFMGFWKLYGPAKQAIDAMPESNRGHDKLMLWLTVAIIALVLLYPYILPVIL